MTLTRRVIPSTHTKQATKNGHKDDAVTKKHTQSEQRVDEYRNASAQQIIDQILPPLPQLL